jgi:hypothetical protein
MALRRLSTDNVMLARQADAARADERAAIVAWADTHYGRNGSVRQFIAELKRGEHVAGKGGEHG